MPDEGALDLIGEIYDAALDPEQWPRTMAKVTAFIGAQPAALLAAPGAADVLSWCGALSLAEPAQRQRLQLLAPHLVRAAEVMHRLRDAKARATGALGALEGVGCGVVILGERGDVSFTNPAARRIFADDDGIKLRGRLFAADPRAQRALEAAIADCLRPHPEPHDCSRGLRVPRRSKRPDYVVQVTSLATRTDLRASGEPGAAIVFISDPDWELSLDEALLRRTYALTPAEARLAQLLLNGHTLASAARRLKIGQTTAKTQLQHIFRKTGTHRQAELVKLLLSLAATPGR
jgi:DNA-binding CsgD family transcriptional regulator/PAS domain-containing protein